MVVVRRSLSPGDLSTMWSLQLDCNVHGDTLHGVQPVLRRRRPRPLGDLSTIEVIMPFTNLST